MLVIESNVRTATGRQTFSVEGDNFAPIIAACSLQSLMSVEFSQLLSNSRLQTIVSKLFQRRKIYSSLPYVCLNERWNFQ